MKAIALTLLSQKISDTSLIDFLFGNSERATLPKTLLMSQREYLHNFDTVSQTLSKYAGYRTIPLTPLKTAGLSSSTINTSSGTGKGEYTPNRLAVWKPKRW
jgi:hypothetical protein